MAKDPKVKKELGILNDYEVYSALIFGTVNGKTEARQRWKLQILKRID